MSGSRQLVKAPQRGRVKPGHKYVRRWWDPRLNRWRYEYHIPAEEKDHGGSHAMVVGLPGERVGVAIDPTPELKQRLKDLGGRWDPSGKVWAFDAKTYLEKVRPELPTVLYDPEATETLRQHEPEIPPLISPRKDEPEEGGKPGPKEEPRLEEPPPQEAPGKEPHGGDEASGIVGNLLKVDLLEPYLPLPTYGKRPTDYSQKDQLAMRGAVRLIAGITHNAARSKEASGGAILTGGKEADRFRTLAWTIAALRHTAQGKGVPQGAPRMHVTLRDGQTVADRALIVAPKARHGAIRSALEGVRWEGGEEGQKIGVRHGEDFLVVSPEDLEDPEIYNRLKPYMALVVLDGDPRQYEDHEGVKRALGEGGFTVFNAPQMPKKLRYEVFEAAGFHRPFGLENTAELHQRLESFDKEPILWATRQLVKLPGKEESPNGQPSPTPPREGKGKPAGGAQPSLWDFAKALGLRHGKRLVIPLAKAEVRNIPASRLRWPDRPRERKELPGEHFLLPEERKFPYKNKDGSVNCRLLRAAISRAAQHGYKEVEERARRLYKRHCQKKEADEG